MELKTVLKALEIAGAIGAVMFLGLLVLWRFSGEVLKKIETPPKQDSAGLIRLMLALLAGLAFAGLVAFVYHSRISVSVTDGETMIDLSSPSEVSLPPVTINRKIVVQSSAIDPTVIDRIEHQAVQIRARDEALESERKARKETDRALAKFQFANIRQNIPVSVEVLRDLAVLRNYSIPLQVFHERWTPRLPNESERQLVIDRALISFGFATLEGGNIRISEKGIAVLSENGGIPEAHVESPRPSWCVSASSPTERAICHDGNLAANEVRVLQLFAEDKQRRGQLAVDEQIKWRREARDRCSTLECLRSVYANRIEQLTHANQAAAF